MLNYKIPVFAEAPARRTRLWQVGASRRQANVKGGPKAKYQNSKESLGI
jgi:hypothetical protein